jgi:hypothetical protein
MYQQFPSIPEQLDASLLLIKSKLLDNSTHQRKVFIKTIVQDKVYSLLGLPEKLGQTKCNELIQMKEENDDLNREAFVKASEIEGNYIIVFMCQTKKDLESGAYNIINNNPWKIYKPRTVTGPSKMVNEKIDISSLI